MENSTQEGASIQERLENFLTSENQEPVEEQVKQSVTEEAVEAQEDGGEEVEERQISTTDLAQYLGIDEGGVDVDEDGTILIKTKIDGQEGKAKLKDLLTSYQLRGHLDNETRKAAEQNKLLQAKVAEADEAINARFEQAEAIARIAQDQLLREFKGVDWESLRSHNPGEYSALFQDFQMRQGQIQQALQEAQLQKQQQSAKAMESMRAMLEEEAKRLPDLIPEWKDSETATREKKDIRAWALKEGFPEEELNHISRTHYVTTLRKAMLYDKLQASKPSVENKVKVAPKLVKPGQSVTQGQRESENVKSLKTNVKKTGGKGGSLEAYLLATGKV